MEPIFKIIYSNDVKIYFTFISFVEVKKRKFIEI